MQENKSILKLQEILNNQSRTLDIENIGTVMVRDPTTQDRIDSKEEAKKDPRWNELNESERNSLVLDMLSLKMIVEPVITRDDYYKANSVILSNLLGAVIMDYTKRYKKLEGKRSKEWQDFLDQTKENNQKSSISS